MMWSWAMLTPSRSRRSLEAHLSWPIVARKSAMMAAGRVCATVAVGRFASDGRAIVRVTRTILVTRTIAVNVQ